jgi:PKD repeat protein
MKHYIFSIILILTTLFSKAQIVLPMNGGIKCQGVIYKIKADTIHHKLYVGGDFTGIEGIQANNIAVWDGQKWDSLDIGTDEAVYDIEIDNNIVYVSGIFKKAGGKSLPSLAAWDGSQWISVANNSATGLVSDVEVFNNELYITGTFQALGPLTAIRVAKWTGNNWTTFGAGFDYYPKKMVKHKDKLYFIGDFHHFAGDTANTLAWIDTSGNKGGLKSNIYAYFSNVRDILFINDTMYLAANNGVYYFANNNYTSLYSTATDAYQIFRYKDTLYVAYYLNQLKEFRVAEILNQTLQIPIISVAGNTNQSGQYGLINTIETTDTCFFVGGDFTKLNSLPVASMFLGRNGIITPFGSSGAQYSGNSYAQVNTLCKQNQTGNVYAGGLFQVAGNKLASNVAMWDGAEWQPLGDGFSGPVNSLLFYNGSLYAGGKFVYSGNTIVNNIAKWDGVQWQPLGIGSDAEVTKLIKRNGKLVIGGAFTSIDGVQADYIAEYDGTTFTALGSLKPLTEPVYDLELYHGRLYASLNQFGMFALYGNYWRDKNFPGTFALNLLNVNDTLFIGSQYAIQAWNDTSYFPIQAINYATNKYYPHIINRRFYASTVYYLAKRNAYEISYHVYGITPNATLELDSTHSIIAGKMPRIITPYYTRYLDNIGIMEDLQPIASLSVSNDTICPFQYVTYTTISDDLFLKHDWDFPGGTPDTANHPIESIQYLNPGKYPVTLTVTNDLGSLTLTYSDSITINNCTTSLQYSENIQPVTLFPNPVGTTLFVRNNTTDFLTATIFNTFGQKCKSFTILSLDTSDIQMEEYSSGIYFIEYSTPSSRFTHKFIHQ